MSYVYILTRLTPFILPIISGSALLANSFEPVWMPSFLVFALAFWLPKHERSDDRGEVTCHETVHIKLKCMLSANEIN